MQNFGILPELFVSHLIDFVDFLLKVELIVFLADVFIELCKGLFNIRLTFMQNFDILKFCLSGVVNVTQLLFDIIVCPSSNWGEITLNKMKSYNSNEGQEFIKFFIGKRIP